MKPILVLCWFWWTGMCPLLGQDYLKEAPIWVMGTENNFLAVYGYCGEKLSNGVIGGEIQKDSSVFLSGFQVRNREEILFGESELSIYRLSKNKDSLYVDLIMVLPVGKDMTWQYVPVIRYVIGMQDQDWRVSKPQSILDVSQLTKLDFLKMKKDLGWDQLKPEIMFPRNLSYDEDRLSNAFLICLKYFPAYNAEYLKLDRGDGAMAEIFQEYAEILKKLE